MKALSTILFGAIGATAILFGSGFGSGFGSAAMAQGLVIISDSPDPAPAPQTPPTDPLDRRVVLPGPIPRPGPVPVPQPRPRPRPLPRPDRLETTSQRVETTIRNQVAATKIIRALYNPTGRRMEGTVIFPVPPGAALEDFTLEMDGEQVSAELLPSEKARRIYEDIVRQTRDPALLEYIGQGAYRARIFPFEPHATRTVTLSYRQLLQADGTLISYSCPLGQEQPKSFSIAVDLRSALPLKTIYSPTHEVEVRRSGARRATVGFEGSGSDRSQKDFQLYFSRETGDWAADLLAFAGDGNAEEEAGFFALLASPGTNETDSILPKDVVFVLDTSGSMAGKKLEQAKRALRFCIANLNEADRFEVVRFSTEPEALFDALTPADPEHRDRAVDFVDGLRPIGGTAIDQALRTARKIMAHGGAARAAGRPGVVIFLTDGLPTVGVTDLEAIVRNATEKTESTRTPRIFCFGIGTDVNTHLLDRITRESRAYSQYVLPEEDIEVKVSGFFNRIRNPVLTDPELTFPDGMKVSQLHPAELPDLFEGDQLVVTGRFRGKPRGTITLTGKMGDRSVTRKFQVRTRAKASNDFVPRLWATRRIGYLLDEIRLHSEKAELKAEITALARRYGVVTPYTAYLILEDEERSNRSDTFSLLPQLRRDSTATAQARSVYRRFLHEETGDAAVAGARFGARQKQAQTVSGALSAGRSSSLRGAVAAPVTGPDPAGLPANRLATRNLPAPAAGVPAPAADTASLRLAEYSEQNRYVAGRTFYLHDDIWIDERAQQHSDAPVVRVEFGSDEYYDLLVNHPETRPWIALGTRVTFHLNGRIYQIRDSDPAPDAE